MKKINIIFLVLFLVAAAVGIGKFFFLDYSPIPEKSEFSISLEELRARLGDNHLELPLAVNSLTTGRGELIKMSIVAGENSIPNHYIQTSFQIAYADKSVILDTPMGEEQLRQFKYGKEFFKENYAILQKGMREADILIFTHEHWDHTGGLAKSPSLNELLGKTILTKEQINSPLIKEADFPQGILSKMRPLDYEKYHQIAPGIIMIKAPGHTAGHQWIYVKLQNGNEFLFTGDTIWNFANIVMEKGRPLLVNWVAGENRRQIADQIRWLHDEVYRNKKERLHIVLSHDPEILEDLIERNIIGDSFKF